MGINMTGSKTPQNTTKCAQGVVFLECSVNNGQLKYHTLQWHIWLYAACVCVIMEFYGNHCCIIDPL